MTKRPRTPGRPVSTRGGRAPARAALWLLPSLLAAGASLNVLRNGLAYDDFWVLSHVHGMMGAATAFLTFRGLSFLSHALDLTLWGERYAGHHLTNLLIHVANTLLATGLARRLTRSDLAALGAGLLFAVHPAHVEVVASIGNRKDSLAMVALFGSLLALLDARRPGRGLVLALLLFALGLWAKEATAVGLVVLAPLALLVVRPQAPDTWTVRRVRARGAAFLGLGLLGTLVFGAGHGDAFTPTAIRRTTEGVCSDYPRVACEVLASVPDNARLLLFPASLSPDYPPHGPHAGGAALAGALIVLAALGLVAWLRRRSPVAAFGVAWVMLLYLPSSNIVPLTQYFIAERYLYGPSFGLCLALGVGAAWLLAHPALAGRKAARAAVAAALLLPVALATARTASGNATWRDERTLWASALNAHPEGSGRIFLNLATEQAERGDLAGAIENYRSALRFWPDDPVVGMSLATALRQSDRVPEAAELLRTVVRANPEDARPWAALGATLVAYGRQDSAIVAYRRAVALDTADTSSRVNLGALLADLAAPAPALAYLEELARAHADLPIAHVLRGTALLRSGDRGAAERAYRQALRLRPDYLPALVSLAWCLAAGPAPAPGQVAEALGLARRASAAVDGANPLALQCLAVVEQAAGEDSTALATAADLHQRAVQLADRSWQLRAEALLESLRAGRRGAASLEWLPNVEFLFSEAE